MSRLALDPAVQFVWALANGEASLSGAGMIEPVHVFAALLIVLDDFFHDDARSMGLPEEGIRDLQSFGARGRARLQSGGEAVTRARRELARRLREATAPTSVRMLHRSPACRALFQDAAARAAAHGHERLTPDVLLEATLRSARDDVRAWFPSCPIDEPDVKPAFEQSQESAWQSLPPRPASARAGATTEGIGRDLSRLAAAGRLPPVVGRRAEMRMLGRFLLRTTKRGVLIVGPAGVGKTAIVEGLAQRVAAGNVPDALRALRFMQVNVADLVAGTKYRGDLEQRLTTILREAEADPDLVLFIDEMHLVMQSPGTGSPLDIANILKPFLARDDLRCIGATTWEEYERHIRADPAFTRRFQLLAVQAPTADEAREMAATWARRIEAAQHVRFEPAAIDAAIRVARERVPDRALPDSAIDLLENSAAFAQVTSLTPDAAAPRKERPVITPATIATVADEVYGPELGRTASLQLDGLRGTLQGELIGQDAAIDAVVETLELRQFHSKAGGRPFAIMLLTGPTGTGKTMTAEALARTLFPGADQSFVRLDMSEIKERHELARLTGAPPGFVGHEHDPPFFRLARDAGRGVVLLDEMDKAHPEIQDYFLQIFDKGTARDPHGKQVSFANVIFIMTCNASEAGAPSIGFTRDRGAALEKASRMPELSQLFRPEFLARVDRVVAYRPLAEADRHTLVRRQFAALQTRVLRDWQARVVADEASESAMATLCSRSSEGAREVIRNFERIVALPILRAIRSADTPLTVTLRVSDRGELSITATAHTSSA